MTLNLLKSVLDGKDCVTVCPDGKYKDVATNQCLNCDNACATCSSSGSTNCSTCKSSEYLYQG